jgi:hypothetical protein
MTKAQGPRYKDGKGAKKPDNGLLPILHPIIVFSAVKGHRVRGYASKLFAEANKKIEWVWNDTSRCGANETPVELDVETPLWRNIRGV